MQQEEDQVWLRCWVWETNYTAIFSQVEPFLKGWGGGASMTRDVDVTPQMFLCLQGVTENVFPLPSLRSGDGNSLLEYCTERKIQISGLVVFILTGNVTKIEVFRGREK